jgi:hypothetical protein
LKANAETLGANLLHNVDSSWRTANDFLVQIHFHNKPRPRTPLAPTHVGLRLLDHWKTQSNCRSPEKRKKFDDGEIDAAGAERPRQNYYRDYASSEQDHPYANNSGFIDALARDRIGLVGQA